MIGAAVLQLRQRFGHGLRVAWYRDIVRPRILQTPPVRGTTDKTCEIHVLTSAKDWLNLTWTLKSFYRVTSRHFLLCIHEDGSLSPGNLKVLAEHFPNARIVTKAEADDVVLPALAHYPRCRHFRRTNHLAPKLFDFHYLLRSERMLLVDSDVLFFSNPTALLQRIEERSYCKNCFNADDETAYTITAEQARLHLGIDLIPKVNSGLAVIQKGSVPLEWVEEFLAVPGLATGHFWRVEQTLHALCSSRFGMELLPPSYSVHLRRAFGNSPCRHYVGAVRHLFYSEGIRYLSHCGLLNTAAIGESNERASAALNVL